MNFIAIIPARYASTRFPGKPLADIGGKSMIQRVYEQALQIFKNVVVATDDERIEKTVVDFGGNAIMTSHSHPSGTDRCYEAAEKLFASGNSFNVVVNIQGDEPFIKPEQLKELISCFDDNETEIATLVKPFKRVEDIFNPNFPKVVFSGYLF